MILSRIVELISPLIGTNANEDIRGLGCSDRGTNRAVVAGEVSATGKSVFQEHVQSLLSILHLEAGLSASVELLPEKSSEVPERKTRKMER